MDLKFTELHLTLEGINNRIEGNTKYITEAEARILDAEDHTTSLSYKIAALGKEVKTLSQRAEDGENCSRRENIRIIGLKEGTEGQQPVQLFESWLPNLLGLQTKRGSIKIDRAHRSLGPLKEKYTRPVIIKLHNFCDKQRIMAAVKEKGKLLYNRNQIYIRQDLSAQVRQTRREFNDVCQHLIARGICFQMRFPSSHNTHNNQDYTFKCPRNAWESVQDWDK